jgi:hypothetical protein
MKLTFYTALALVLLLAQSVRAEVANSDELAIYRDLFSGMKTVVLEKPDPKAKPSPDYSYNAAELAEAHALFKKRFPQVDDATISYFLNHKLHQALLTPKSDVGVKLIFLEPTTFEAICESTTDSCWMPFRKQFPGATIVSTCRFRFNASKTQALVSIFWSLDGDPREFLLEKRDGKWIVESSSLESGAW